MHSRFTRWAVGTAMALSMLLAAGVAQASSLTSTQVSAILSLLQSFGADQATINNVSAALGGNSSSGGNVSTSVVAPQCVTLSDNLAVGSSGSNVMSFQNYLVDQGYLSAAATGYFGSLTQQAVLRLQTARGISAVGSVGPQTRDAIGCGSTTTVSPAQPVQPTQPTRSNSAPPIGTIDPSPLASSTGNPTIAGTATNTNTVRVTLINTANGQFAYDSGDAGIPVTTGRWTTTVETSLPNGTYDVVLYADNGGPTLTRLTIGTLSVMSAVAPTATIDQSTLTQTISPFVLTGSVSASSGLTVFLIPTSYSGSRDYSSLLTDVSRAAGQGTSAFGAGEVSNGRWAATLGLQNSGTYMVLVFDGTSNTLLATGTLTLTVTPVPKG